MTVTQQDGEHSVLLLADTSDSHRHSFAPSTESYSNLLKIEFDNNRALDVELRPLNLSDHVSQHGEKPSHVTYGPPSSFPWYRRLVAWSGKWGWETGACLGCFLTFMATVGLLAAFDEKTQPDWPYGVTLNSAVSFLTTLLKGFLLVPAAACISQSIWISYTLKAQELQRMEIYDAASRGPWGALQLLWTLRARRLACMGALITLLAIGIDPTVQQAIVIRTRYLESEQHASLPRGKSFLQYESGFAPMTFAPPASLVGLLYSGMFLRSSGNIKTSLDIAPNCPTNNCTFPAFQSLAACFGCRNITQAVSTTCTDISYEADNDTVTYNYCTSKLPNGLQINQTMMRSPMGDIQLFNQKMVASSALLPLVDATDYGGSELTTSAVNVSNPNWMRGNNYGGSILNITFLNGSISGGQNMSKVMVGGRMNAHASQCSLYWCVNTYEANVTNGNLEERVVNSWRDASAWWKPDKVHSYDLMRLKSPGSNASRESSEFVVAWDAENFLWRWLANKLTLSNTYTGAVRNSTKREYNTTTKDFDEWDGPPEFQWEPDASSSFAYDKDQTSFSQRYDLLNNMLVMGPAGVFANLAKAITTYVRTTKMSEQTGRTWDDGGLWDDNWDIVGAGDANGTAYTLQVYIHVRWPWLTFVGSILVLTILFFVLVVAQSARHNVAVWKSSPLALLFHGLKPDETSRADVHSIPEMEKHANKLKVRLRNTGSGTQLEEE